MVRQRIRDGDRLRDGDSSKCASGVLRIRDRCYRMLRDFCTLPNDFLAEPQRDARNVNKRQIVSSCLLVARRDHTKAF